MLQETLHVRLHTLDSTRMDMHSGKWQVASASLGMQDKFWRHWFSDPQTWLQQLQ
jgi:hypothetical protein